MTSKVVETNALGMKDRHTHVTVEGRRGTKPLRTVQTTDALGKYSSSCTTTTHDNEHNNYLFIYIALLSETPLQVRPVDGFLHMMVDSCNGVPFEGLIDTAPHLGVKSLKNPNLGGMSGHFQVICYNKIWHNDVHLGACTMTSVTKMYNENADKIHEMSNQPSFNYSSSSKCRMILEIKQQM